MKNLFIKIDTTNYPVVFNYGSLKILAKSWNVKTFSGLDKNLAKLAKLDPNDVSFDYLDLLGDIVMSGIMYASKDGNYPNRDYVVQYLLENPDKSAELITAFTEAMPHQQQPGKQMPVKRAKKK